MALEAVLFDLDGTLLDTAPDLAAALNRVRATYGHAPLPYAQVRAQVSNGSYALTRLGFDFPEDSPAFETARLALLDDYRENLAQATVLFPGMEELLASFAPTGLRWGIVTNKPGWLTTPLLAQLALAVPPGCVVSGDTLAQRKPHPAPLRHAAALLGCAPERCVYIGDAVRDIEAGRSAGMYTLAASYGYLDLESDPGSWQADAIVESAEAIAAWLASRRGEA